ncbi:hypothetical protein AB1Y20_003260 [Prymnesium parvum]|uniref:CHK kinase-like domain-containing protein n=1 Tax=Prymnesium parvum TaxID=97485 RepID=A0AB34JBH9_PRYPA
MAAAPATQPLRADSEPLSDSAAAAAAPVSASGAPPLSACSSPAAAGDSPPPPPPKVSRRRWPCARGAASSLPRDAAHVGESIAGAPPLRSAEGLTEGWLTAAFRHRGYLSPCGKVTEMTLRPLGEGLGSFGELVKVTVEVEGEMPHCPRRFVAKFAPQGELQLPLFLVRQTFLTETHFYHDFTVEEGGLVRPECYLAVADPSKRQLTFCLLIEDMLPAVSYTRLQARPRPCTFARVAEAHSSPSAPRTLPPPSAAPTGGQVLGALAGLHARWWDNQKTKPLDWVPHPKDYGGAARHVWKLLIRRGFKHLPACFGEVYQPVFSWRRAVLKHHDHIYRLLHQHPLTLCHGDVHLDNVFFHERFPGGCALVDFGNMHLGQGLSDVAFFMATNIPVDARREHEHALLKHYYQTLVNSGVSEESYSWDRCWREYRQQIWRPFVAILTLSPSFAKQKKLRSGMFAESPSPGDASLLKMYTEFNKRLLAALLDHKWIELVLPATEEVERTVGCCQWRSTGQKV